MKKNRISVMALLAIVFAVSSAFVTKIEGEATAKFDPSYFWFNASDVYHMQNTTSAEQSLTGCSSTLATCEKGYTSSQLKNPAQPSQGAKAGEVPQVIIRRNTN